MTSVEFYAEIPLGTASDGSPALHFPDIQISASFDQDGNCYQMEVLGAAETGQDSDPHFDAPIKQHLDDFIERNWRLFEGLAKERLDEVMKDDEAPEYYRDVWMDKTIEVV